MATRSRVPAEVLARADRAYRTEPAPPFRAIGGISYGGRAARSQQGQSATGPMVGSPP